MTSFKTVESLVADITDSEFFRDHPNIVNEQSIYRWVRLALKQFGMNVMQKKSTVVSVDNHRGYLPEEFGKLSLAVYCEQNTYYVNGNTNKDCINQDQMLKDKVNTGYFVYSVADSKDSCEDNCSTSDDTIIEKKWVGDDCEAVFTYTNPIYVKLGRDVLYDFCTSDCVNRFVKDNVYSINIKGTTVYAQFKTGNLYLEYYALPADENGVPVIPETENGFLESYLEYHIKRRLLEDSILSQDSKNRFTIFNFIQQKERELETKAYKDTSPFNMKAFWDAINKRRIDFAKYDVNLGRYPQAQGGHHHHNGNNFVIRR